MSTRHTIAVEQLPLVPTIRTAHRDNGNRIRALLNRAIAEARISVVDLAEETGIDEKQIGRALRDDGGAHPPLALVACVMAKDREAVFVQGLCALVGYEAAPKRRDHAAENRRLRTELTALRERVDRLLGEEEL